jgi:hypothetical protein
MPSRSRFTLLRSIGLAVLIGGAAQAQDNLVMNPGFDTDLTGWANLFGRPAVWSPLDASASPDSGSARVSNDAGGGAGTPVVLTQCFPLSASTEYRLRVQALVPTGQAQFTTANTFALVFGSSDCSGEALQISTVGVFSPGQWELGEEIFQSAVGARSVQIGLGVSKPEGVTELTTAHFDNLSLRPTGAPNVLVIDERLSGSWFNPATSGQGFYLDIAPSINLFFGGWFTWTDVPGQYDWLTVQGGYSGEVALVPIYRTSGGAFNQPVPTSTVPVGIAEFRFFSCSSAEVRFEFTAGGGPTTIPLQRVTPNFPGCVD